VERCLPVPCCEDQRLPETKLEVLHNKIAGTANQPILVWIGNVMGHRLVVQHEPGRE
jgi:siroheme synthase